MQLFLLFPRVISHTITVTEKACFLDTWRWQYLLEGTWSEPTLPAFTGWAEMIGLLSSSFTCFVFAKQAIRSYFTYWQYLSTCILLQSLLLYNSLVYFKASVILKKAGPSKAVIRWLLITSEQCSNCWNFFEKSSAIVDWNNTFYRNCSLVREIWQLVFVIYFCLFVRICWVLLMFQHKLIVLLVKALIAWFCIFLVY